MPRTQLGIGNRHQGEAAAADGGHQSALAFLDGVHRHAGERVRHQAVDEIRAAGAQVVSQVADDGFLAGSRLDVYKRQTMYNTERFRPVYDHKLGLPIFLTRA